MTDFDDVLGDVGRAVRSAEAFDEAMDPDRLTRWVFTLRGAARRFQDLDRDWTEVLAAVAPHGQPTIFDGMVVEASMKSSRTGWDNDAVRREVVRAATYDPTTGAQRDADDAIAVLAKLYPLGGSGLRLTAARDLIPGFDPDEFCKTERKPSVKITEPTTKENV